MLEKKDYTKTLCIVFTFCAKSHKNSQKQALDYFRTG